MKQIISWIILVLVPLGILQVPVPAGLEPDAWKIFAVYCSAILGIILRPASEAVVLLCVIAFGSFIVPLSKLLSGYSDGTVWLVFTAFLITQAFADTGLGKRIAYIMIGKFGNTSLGLAYGQMISDLIISPATPSNTARTGGIVYPIFRNIASTLGSDPDNNPRKIGAYLTINGYHASLSTSAVFLTACAPNVLIYGFAKDILKLQPTTWMDWFIAMCVPALLCCAVTPYILYKFYTPELTNIPNNKELSSKGLEEMGPWSTKEKLLVLFFLLAIVGWATSSYTKINNTAIAIMFFSFSAIFKLVEWKNVLNNNGAWNTLMWYGAVIGLSGILGKAKFFTWLAAQLGKTMDLTNISYIVVFGILLVISLLVRYFFASMGAYVSAFIPVLFTIGLVAKVPPAPLAYLLGASAAYGSILTHYGGAAGPVLFGTGYVPQNTWWKLGAIVTVCQAVIYMTVGLGYWKILGLY